MFFALDVIWKIGTWNILFGYPSLIHAANLICVLQVLKAIFTAILNDEISCNPFKYEGLIRGDDTE